MIIKKKKIFTLFSIIFHLLISRLTLQVTHVIFQNNISLIVSFFYEFYCFDKIYIYVF